MDKEITVKRNKNSRIYGWSVYYGNIKVGNMNYCYNETEMEMVTRFLAQFENGIDSVRQLAEMYENPFAIFE